MAEDQGGQGNRDRNGDDDAREPQGNDGPGRMHPDRGRDKDDLRHRIE